MPSYVIRHKNRYSVRKTRGTVARTATTDLSAYTKARNPNAVSIGRLAGQTLWPDKFVCKLEWSDILNDYNNGSVSPGVVVEDDYRVNDLNNIRVGGTTTPLVTGITELSNLYASYRVTACKATVTIDNMGTTPFICMFIFDHGPIGLNANTMRRSMVDPFATYMVVGPGGSKSAHATMSNYITFGKLFGSNTVYGETKFACINGVGPIAALFGSCVVGPQDSNSVYVLEYTQQLKLEFCVEWFGRQYPNQ